MTNRIPMERRNQPAAVVIESDVPAPPVSRFRGILRQIDQLQVGQSFAIPSSHGHESVRTKSYKLAPRKFNVAMDPMNHWRIWRTE